MPTQQQPVLFYIGRCIPIVYFLLLLFSLNSCNKNLPSADGNPKPPAPPQSTTSASACSCSSTTPATSATATPVSSTTATVIKVDTLNVPPPHFSPNGGNFYFSTAVKLTSDSLPAQGIYEFSLDNGQSWQAGQQFVLTAGGTILTRFRVGDRPSRSRSATFSLYYQRLLVIGNSIMFHGPAAQLGWTNSNGMAASAPEKDFVHLLTARLQALNPAMTLRLQAGTGLEIDFGKATYKMDEFDEPMQTFKPDLVVIRLGENIVDGDVPIRQFESQFRLFIERLVSLSQGRAVKIITTTSVWDKPQADAVIRKVIAEKAFPLVDLSCMVGQGQYFASQYPDAGVAAHPNDAGMQKIADLIWNKLQ